MNAFVHLYLAFYVIFISVKIFYLSITFIMIYILEARCTSSGDPYCAHNIVLYFVPYVLKIILITNQFYFITYLVIFITHLFIILLVPHFTCTP